jgi:hypothetical protein
VSTRNAVVFIITDQWDSLFIQGGFNVCLFILGLSFFACRRQTHVSVPFWNAHSEALFERDPFWTITTTADKNHCHNVPPSAEQNSNSNSTTSGRSQASGHHPLAAPTLKERARRFWNMPCDGDYVSNACGVDSALFLRFQLDAGHMFSFLTFTCAVILLPIVRQLHDHVMM